LDGRVVDGNSLIIMEMTTVAFPALLFERGDPTLPFAADADSRSESRMPGVKFIEKLQQLHAAVIALESVWKLPGVDSGRLTEVFLVIVLLHPMPQSPDIWQRLRQATGSEWMGGYVLPAKSSPPEIFGPRVLDCEELEMIEPLIRRGSYSLRELLRRKISDLHYRELSIKDWLLPQSGFDVPENRRLLDRFKEVADELTCTIAPHEASGE
jgi:hypothetical protein